MTGPAEPPVRRLVLVLGDQLDTGSAAFDGFDAARDAVWMAEVDEEAEHVWSHQARIALFLTAMRHFRDELRARGLRVHYRALEDPGNRGSFAAELREAVRELAPQQLTAVQPGEWRVREAVTAAARESGVPLEWRTDRHFLCAPEDFSAHVQSRRQLRMEHFYREMRRRTGWLMEGDRPVGGSWNYDVENRGSFGRDGPGEVPGPRRFPPDELTQDVLRLVQQRFGNHPGSLAHFDWPVTAVQAQQALDDFVAQRLPLFGRYQDAMWAGEPFLYHSRLSAAANLKLLDPRDVLAAAAAALETNHAPLTAVEGFGRQWLGWREYIRGVYWHYMPGYADSNAWDAQEPLPTWYWTGQTDLNCLREVLTEILAHGYAHHIQRLMVTGLFALLLGVEPRQVHQWYLAMFVDAVEWVEMPNVLGMSQHADGGLLASKPYVASGKYLARMSNYCRSCRYNPNDAVGDDACPFTTLYWEFLLRHQERLAENPRMALQVRNARRLTAPDQAEVCARAAIVRQQARHG